MKKSIFILFLFFAFQAIFAETLLIKPTDLRLEAEIDKTTSEISGYHLFVRKRDGLESVLLTETTKDPLGKADNYAYRANEYNAINGDEIRFLDGKKLESEGAKYSLIDSTPEKDEKFGEAFHIFIPREMHYGYAWSRNGIVKIDKGVFVNIRAFSKKYADYTGDFYDNPYMFDFEKRKVPIPPAPTNEVVERRRNDKELVETILTDDYNPMASETFKEISSDLIYSKGPDSIVDDVMEIIDNISPKNEADIVFAIDATGSMKDDIGKLKKDLSASLLEKLPEFSSVRLGLLLYRDYGDNYKYKSLPVKFYDWTSDVNLFIKNLNAVTIRGTEGGDIPEPVYEALYASLEFYNWRSTAQRKIILIGDAEPHPYPRGIKKCTKDIVLKMAKEKAISINAIITPDEKYKRGR